MMTTLRPLHTFDSCGHHPLDVGVGMCRCGIQRVVGMGPEGCVAIFHRISFRIFPWESLASKRASLVQGRLATNMFARM